MYSMVTVVSDTLWHVWKLLGEELLKVFITGKKNGMYAGDGF